MGHLTPFPTGPPPALHEVIERCKLLVDRHVDGVLITPFPARKDGPTAGETIAIKAMQRRLTRSRVAVWISQDGKLTPQEIASGVLAAKAGAHVTVRLLGKNVPPAP